MKCWNCKRPVSTERPVPVGSCDGQPRFYMLADEFRCRSDRYRLADSDPRQATAHDGRPR
jgi:hypothetical protein